MSQAPLTLEDLDAHLFKCADIIRNTVDKTDYKDYILPLVFYKTISDTYHDQYEQKLAEYDDPEIASRRAFYDFVVPDEYSWSELRSRTNRVDEFLNEAFDALSEANEGKLEGVLRADFVRAEGLNDDRLNRLIEHLSTVDLSLEKVPPDMLGEAYMDLVRHFANEEGRDGGEFFTPPQIVRLMVRLLAPFEAGDRFHDPTCGSGGMLIESAYHYRDEQDGDPSKLTFTGQEMNPDIYAIAKMNLFVHGLNGDIRRGDSLREPQFESDGELDTFDYVLANFPFSDDEWPKDDLKDDPWNRFDWADKLPSQEYGDYAYIMHMVKQLNGIGQAAIVIPRGVLFRNNEQRYRKPMIDQDLVEAVINLPENLFQNNTIPSAILILNREKPQERQNQVAFIHAADEAFFRSLSNQNELTDDGIDRIINIFNDWGNEEHFCRIVSKDEIRQNDYYLNVALYVDTTEPESNIEVSEELKPLWDLQDQLDQIEGRLSDYMEALNYSQVIDSPVSTPTSTSERVETPIGLLPTDWDVKSVDEICEVNPEGFSEEDWPHDTFEYITLSNVSHGTILKSETTPINEAPSRAQRRISEGDVLIGTVRPKQVSHGFVTTEHEGKICSSGFGVLRTPPDVNSLYLIQEVLSQRFFRQMEAYVAGSGYPAINIGDLRKHRIAIPPVEEQRKIASVLYTTDQAIEIHRKLAGSSKGDNGGQIQKLKQGLMQDLLSGEVRTHDKPIEVVEEVLAHG